MTNKGKLPSTLFYDKETSRHIMENPDSSIDVKSGDLQMTISEDGDGVHVDANRIKGFGIKDMQNLSNYNITMEDDVITHRFAFGNGVSGIVSFNTSGRIIEFNVSGNGEHAPVSMTLTKEGYALISSTKD